MKRLGLYRFAVRLLPSPGVKLDLAAGQMPEREQDRLQQILCKHKAIGGALAVFDARGIQAHLVYGMARKNMPVQPQTAFRLASISKMVSAAGILKLREEGLVSLDRDTDWDLPFSLRHPGAPNTPVTLRMLLSHTAAINDGGCYIASLMGGVPAEQVLEAPDSHTAHLPGKGCEYSNFGVGLAGVVVEAQTGLSFEKAMQQYLFEPLHMQASYYPSLLKAPLADAWRVLPPRRKPNFDAKERQARAVPGWDLPDVRQHYLLAHGSCCLDLASAVSLGQALLEPGFLSRESLEEMRTPLASLGEKDPYIRQGLGTFILEDPRVCPYSLYGHQGMAYGAVQMMILDLAKRQGIISLTTGASEAREHVLTDLNKDLLRWCLGNG